MFERCLYFNSNVLARKLNSRWEVAFSRYDLSPSHVYLLRVVLDKPGLTQQTLANLLHIERSTLARFVDVLEAKELVCRQCDEVDARMKVIVPSAKAEELRTELEALGDALYKELCEKYGVKKVESLVATMREFADRF